MIEELTDLVNALLSLFPAPEASQRQLRKAELSDLGDETFIILRDVSRGNDELLEEVSTETLDDRGVQSWRNIKGDGRAERLMRNDYSGLGHTIIHQKRQEWVDILGIDEARQIMGNVYEGGRGWKLLQKATLDSQSNRARSKFTIAVMDYIDEQQQLDLSLMSKEQGTIYGIYSRRVVNSIR